MYFIYLHDKLFKFFVTLRCRLLWRRLIDTIRKKKYWCEIYSTLCSILLSLGSTINACTIVIQLQYLYYYFKFILSLVKIQMCSFTAFNTFYYICTREYHEIDCIKLFKSNIKAHFKLQYKNIANYATFLKIIVWWTCSSNQFFYFASILYNISK